jgi:hypothetical protein
MLGMATTINELLDELASSATSTSDKGNKLGTLMQSFQSTELPPLSAHRDPRAAGS